MALLSSRYGSLIRRSISLNGACASSNGSVPMTSMHNAVSSSKLFIGGLSFGTNDQSLKDAFSRFGDVIDAKVMIDKYTGRSRGFGFVNYSSDKSASSALSAMDGQELNGRNIHVSYAIAGGYRGDGVSVKKLIMECKHLFVDKSM